MMGFDLQKMMKQAQAIQDKMGNIQEEMEQEEVTGTAGGGAVTVTCNGKHVYKAVSVSPEALEDKEVLQEMLLAALNDASKQVEELGKRKMAQVTQGFNIPGLNLPGMF